LPLIIERDDGGLPKSKKGKQLSPAALQARRRSQRIASAGLVVITVLAVAFLVQYIAAQSKPKVSYVDQQKQVQAAPGTNTNPAQVPAGAAATRRVGTPVPGLPATGLPGGAVTDPSREDDGQPADGIH
jgi:hypothetical protein